MLKFIRQYFTVTLAMSSLMMIASGSIQAADRVLTAGIVGCDTSHVIHFTNAINDPAAKGALANVEVKYAYPGGSNDLAGNEALVADYVGQLRERGITIVDSLDELCKQCDVFLLESVDGRVHREQFQAIANGKPVFLDKPAAASLADVIAIFRHADETHTPVYTSSALRFCDAVQSLVNDKEFGTLLGCETVGPLKIEPHHPDLFWYGIHGVESLYTIMGAGCESVSCIDSDVSMVVVGKWRDGRMGVYRGMKKGGTLYSFTVLGAKEIEFRSGFSGYEPAIEEIGKFLTGGKPPVRREDTIEMFAFMEAASESKRLGGRPVEIHRMFDRAERELANNMTGPKPSISVGSGAEHGQ